VDIMQIGDVNYVFHMQAAYYCILNSESLTINGFEVTSN